MNSQAALKGGDVVTSNERITRISERFEARAGSTLAVAFVPPSLGDDALLLIAAAGVGAAVLLVVAGVVEAAIALHGWLTSYTEPDGGRS